MNIVGFIVLVISFSLLLIGFLLVIKHKKLGFRILGTALIIFSVFFLFLLNEARKEIPIINDYKVFKKIDSQVTHKKYFKVGIKEDKTTQIEVSEDTYNKYKVGDTVPTKPLK